MFNDAPNRQCDAPHDENYKKYDVEFASYEKHAKDHLPKNNEDWAELLSHPAWKAAETVTANDALAYKSYAYDIVQRCFTTPRYVRCYDFEPRKDGKANSILFASKREWKSSHDIAFYFACYETGILASGTVVNQRIYLRTCHRSGHKIDTPKLRENALKKRVLKMTEGMHENHLLVPMRWYSISEWAL